MTRDEHMQWCKDRALEYVNAGDMDQALGSMLSDLEKHAETADHPGKQMGVVLMMAGQLKSPAEMRKFIDGFN